MVEKFSITQREESKSKVWTPNLEQITSMKLTELAKRDIAIQIFSEILDCEIWLCSNEAMEIQIKKDDPAAITYTIDEIMNLIKLNPDPEELKRIHNAKEVFVDSKIVDSRLGNEESKGKAGN